MIFSTSYKTRKIAYYLQGLELERFSELRIGVSLLNHALTIYESGLQRTTIISTYVARGNASRFEGEWFDLE